MHSTRVAIRRFRSTLRTFGPLFEQKAALDLSDRLQEYAGRLGGVRDLQVLDAVIAAHSSPELHGHLSPRLEAELSAAWAQLELALERPEYAGLLDDVDSVLLGAGPGHGKPAKRAKKAAKIAARRLHRAGDDPDRLHVARKAAKRARYAAEAIGDGKTAARWERVQEHLGVHHDCSVAEEWAAGAAEHPDHGVLVDRLRATAAAARDRAAKAGRDAGA